MVVNTYMLNLEESTTEIEKLEQELGTDHEPLVEVELYVCSGGGEDYEE